MNILFVMKHRGNAGNTHAVADYMRVGERFGHTVAMYGPPQPWLPGLRFSMDIKAFDKIVYLFESELYRVPRVNETALLASFPRKDRIILDMDGMYNPRIVLDGYDRNHNTDEEREQWIEYYDALADRVVKPCIAKPDHPRVTNIPFYGYDPGLELDPADAPPKQYDILHVGHNWWRGKEVVEKLLPAFSQIRDDIGRIGFIGLWWDAPPVEENSGRAEAFRGDAAEFRRLNIETSTAVMYNEVIRTMSSARINIFTQRPVLHHLRHLTLKYFEIFYADTIPLLMLDPDHAVAVYGPAARELTLHGTDVAAKIRDALQRPEDYMGVVADVRQHLRVHQSYERRVEELIGVMQA